MKKYIILSFIAFFCLVMACDDGETEAHSTLDIALENAMTSAGYNKIDFLFPPSDDYSNIPQDPLNPLTAEKVALGKLLYHETGLALNPRQPSSLNTYSCASCHFASAGFQTNRLQGLGDGGRGFGINGENRVKSDDYDGAEIDAQAIRTPTVLNCAYQQNMLWNGQFGATGANTGTENLWTPNTPKFFNTTGFEGVEIQSIASMGVHRMEIDTNDLITTIYKDMFDDAFGDIPETERYSREKAGLAIAAYERTLLATEAPYQKWLNGDSKALTLNQKQGAVIFFEKAGCINCHNSPALNNMDFHNLGMNDLYQEDEIEIFKTFATSAENYGRGGYSGEQEDFFAFKTPQLYNLKDSPFYGHGGSFRSIEEVIKYKNAAIPQNEDAQDNTDALFQPLGLSEQEMMFLADFLINGLYDPNLKRYEPTSLPSGLCFPNNDSISKKDLNCN